MVDRYVRSNMLALILMNSSQYAHQIDKSIETALHCERAFYKDVLGVLIDIQKVS